MYVKFPRKLPIRTGISKNFHLLEIKGSLIGLITVSFNLFYSDLLRKRITEKIFDDMIERSEPSIKLIEQTNPNAPFLKEIRETGNLPLDFQAIYDATVEMTNSDEG